jgi:hypothetical protein
MTRDLLIGLVAWSLVIAVGAQLWVSFTGPLALY